MKKLDAVRFPFVSRIELQNYLIVYQKQEDYGDLIDLRVSYLGEAYKYSGESVKELFKRVCQDKDVELIAAIQNLALMQWIFYYLKRR